MNSKETCVNLTINLRDSRRSPWNQHFRRNNIVANDHVIGDRVLRLWPRGFVVKIVWTGLKKPFYFCSFTKMPSSNPLPPKENALFKRILVSNKPMKILCFGPHSPAPIAKSTSSDKSTRKNIEKITGKRVQCTYSAWF